MDTRLLPMLAVLGLVSASRRGSGLRSLVSSRKLQVGDVVEILGDSRSGFSKDASGKLGQVASFGSGDRVRVRWPLPNASRSAVFRLEDLRYVRSGSALRALKAPLSPAEERLHGRFLTAFARTIFVTRWADVVEEEGRKLSGLDLFKAAPKTLDAARRRAQEWMEEFEKENGLSVIRARELVLERDPKAHGSSVSDFAHALAMEAMGSGVSWSDDYKPHGFEVPDVENYDLFFGSALRAVSPVQKPKRAWYEVKPRFSKKIGDLGGWYGDWNGFFRFELHVPPERGPFARPGLDRRTELRLVVDGSLDEPVGYFVYRQSSGYRGGVVRLVRPMCSHGELLMEYSGVALSAYGNDLFRVLDDLKAQQGSALKSVRSTSRARCFATLVPERDGPRDTVVHWGEPFLFDITDIVLEDVDKWRKVEDRTYDSDELWYEAVRRGQKAPKGHPWKDDSCPFSVEASDAISEFLATLEGSALKAVARTFKKSAGLLLLHKPSRQILIGLRRGDNTWSLPGGGVEPGESPISAARRETFEEFGIRHSAVPILIWDEPDFRYTTFVVWSRKLSDFSLDLKEHIEGQWVDYRTLFSGKFNLHPGFEKALRGGLLKRLAEICGDSIEGLIP
jgi:hypothetical protein